jgi:hypothetical protein
MIVAFKKRKYSSLGMGNFKRMFGVTKQPYYEYRGKNRREFNIAMYAHDRYSSGARHVVV